MITLDQAQAIIAGTLAHAQTSDRTRGDVDPIQRLFLFPPDRAFSHFARCLTRGFEAFDGQCFGLHSVHDEGLSVQRSQLISTRSFARTRPSVTLKAGVAP